MPVTAPEEQKRRVAFNFEDIVAAQVPVSLLECANTSHWAASVMDQIQGQIEKLE